MAASKDNANDANLDTLTECMKKLEEGDLQLVQVCYGDGVPVRQVAAELSRSPQSVHNSLRRIRLTLLKCIERLLNREDYP
jgi:RNA polymerase sigma-70 factor (ECF subfamily)